MEQMVPDANYIVVISVRNALGDESNPHARPGAHLLTKLNINLFVPTGLC